MSVSFSGTACSQVVLGKTVPLTPSRREGIRFGVETIQSRVGLRLKDLCSEIEISRSSLHQIINGTKKGNERIFLTSIYQSTLEKIKSVFKNRLSSDEFSEFCALFSEANVSENIEQVIVSGTTRSKGASGTIVRLTPSRREGIRFGVEMIRSRTRLTFQELGLQIGISGTGLHNIVNGKKKGNERIFPASIHQSRLEKIESLFKKHLSSDEFSKFCALFSGTNVSPKSPLVSNVLASRNTLLDKNEDALLASVLENGEDTGENTFTTNENEVTFSFNNEELPIINRTMFTGQIFDTIGNIEQKIGDGCFSMFGNAINDYEGPSKKRRII
jgi:DNA-binding Xre family transcriptional regulator